MTFLSYVRDFFDNISLHIRMAFVSVSDSDQSMSVGLLPGLTLGDHLQRYFDRPLMMVQVSHFWTEVRFQVH